MEKIRWILFGLFFIPAFTANSVAWSLSVNKPPSSELLKYTKGSEFVKLSYSQFITLTGQKPNLWNKLSFTVIKMKVKHDLKKHPALELNNIFVPQKSAVLKVLFWILIGLFALLGLFFIIYGFAPR